MRNFKIVALKEGGNSAQVKQFVEMMSRMYDFHATLHDDWKTKSNWQSGSAGWIKRAAGGDEFYFAMAYPLDGDGNDTLEPPAGYVIGSFHYEAPLFVQNRFGYIADLWVEPPYRGTGAAQALMNDAFDWFRQQGVSRVQIEVDVENKGGLRFWEKAGFEPFEIVLRRNI
jgi:ribosomal protein S18 acetylase RimI-like enzyme